MWRDLQGEDRTAHHRERRFRIEGDQVAHRTRSELGHRTGKDALDKGAPLAQRGTRVSRPRVVLCREQTAHRGLQDVGRRIGVNRLGHLLER
jgi:hypothetical protein